MEANSREDQELDMLAEAIGVTMEAEQGSADFEGGAVVSASKSPTSIVSEVNVDDPCEGRSCRAGKNFWKVLESESLGGMAGAYKDAMNIEAEGVRCGWLRAEVLVAIGSMDGEE